MDYKQIRQRLSEITGSSEADVDVLVEGLAAIIGDRCADLDAVAIPTFGTFRGIKHLETETRDLSTGKRLLLPPEIKIEFEAAAMLRRTVTHP